MRIAIVANDTRGGIQPYVALGLGLRRAGHEVRFLAPADFADMVEGAGLPFLPLAGGVELAVRGSGGVAAQGSVASTRFAMRELPKRLFTWTKETLAGCEGVDVMVGGLGGMVLGLSVAEKLKVPFVEAHLQPIGAPTDAYPGVLLSGTPSWLGGWGRRLSHRLSDAALWVAFRPAMAKARRELLGLGGKLKVEGDGASLYGFSHHVVPMPQDGRRERILTGYWTLPAPADWKPSEALQAFLAKSGPVVTIGFGSMPSGDPQALTALVIGAVRKAGVRAVLVAGWGGMAKAEAADDVFMAETVPYDWLLPHVRGLVHHGGAGTTGAGLTSGTPSLVVPFMMDQPFWGARVAALGAGPAPIPKAKLTEANLAEALRVLVSDEEMRARAKTLGEQLRAEDGVGAAVEHFNRLAKG